MEFPVLPLLESIGADAVAAARQALQNAALVGAQHLLLSTGSLVEVLLRLGLRRESVFLLGKCYSQNREVIGRLQRVGIRVVSGSEPGTPGTFASTIDADTGRLWNEVRIASARTDLDSIIVLDDGGHCLGTIPRDLHRRFRVVGVEQTTSGIRRTPMHDNVPVVSVATCAAKRHFEPPLISRAVLRRLQAFLPRGAASVVGIVGLGPIGSALARDLVASGHRVFVYDRRITQIAGAAWCDGIDQLLERVEVLLGCTGEDSLSACNWQTLKPGTTVVASCSSEDREFVSLLRRAPTDATPPYRARLPLSIKVKNHEFRMLRAGYPINFDGSIESVPAHDIQLTRALLLAAVLQAVGPRAPSTGSGYEMLSPSVQANAVQRWIALSPEKRSLFPPDLLAVAQDVEWFSGNH